MCGTNGLLTHFMKRHIGYIACTARVKWVEGSDAIAILPGPLGPALAEAFPEQMQRVVRIHTRNRTLRYEERSLRARITYIDPGFWDVFTLPMLKGDPETALDRKDAIVITEKTARRFFGGEDPIGKSISFTGDSEVQHALVTGILEEIPGVSSIQFDCLQSFENVEEALDSWNIVNNTSIYVLLNERADVAALEGQFPRFVTWSWPIMGEKREMKLQPLADVHFSPEYTCVLNPRPTGRIVTSCCASPF